MASDLNLPIRSSSATRRDPRTRRPNTSSSDQAQQGLKAFVHQSVRISKTIPAEYRYRVCLHKSGSSERSLSSRPLSTKNKILRVNSYPKGQAIRSGKNKSHLHPIERPPTYHYNPLGISNIKIGEASDSNKEQKLESSQMRAMTLLAEMEVNKKENGLATTLTRKDFLKKFICEEENRTAEPEIQDGK